MPDSPLVDAMRLEGLGGSRFRAGSVGADRPAVFGGQLLGQAGIAAELATGKPARSIHAVFARAASVTEALDLDVELVHDGRTMASTVVRVRQGERQVCAAIVLLDRGDPDVIRYAEPMPSVPGPDEAGAADAGQEAGSQLRLVDGPAILRADEIGPPRVYAWVRFPDAPAGAGLHRALAAWYTDALLIGAAMRPHPIGQEMAHRSLSTGVLTHTITYHEPVDVTQWHLLAQTSTQAGGGRCYGTGALYTRAGALVASFAQESMIRARIPGAAGSAL